MKSLALGIIFVIITKTAYASTILLETFTQEDSVYQSGGWVLRSDDSYLGIRFHVDDTMYIENIVANLGGRGDFFTGIVELIDSSVQPRVRPGFNPDMLLFYATNSFEGSVSSDVVTAANISLDQGYYAVIFGGLGLWGQNDFGWMPGTTTLDNSTIPLTDYIEYRSENNGWVEFDYSGIRVVLEGEMSAEPSPSPINTVPIPSAVWLFGSGLLGLIGIARRKQSV